MKTAGIHKFRNIVAPNVGAGKQELLSLVLFDQIEQFRCRFVAVKNLTLPDNNVFLQVVGCLLRDTEVLHIRWYLDPTFLANPEEIVDGVPTGEDYSRMGQNADFLLPEIFEGNTLYFNKWSEVNV
jgi:hypothetical protein